MGWWGGVGGGAMMDVAGRLDQFPNKALNWGAVALLLLLILLLLPMLSLLSQQVVLYPCIAIEQVFLYFSFFLKNGDGVVGREGGGGVEMEGETKTCVLRVFQGRGGEKWGAFGARNSKRNSSHTSILLLEKKTVLVSSFLPFFTCWLGLGLKLFEVYSRLGDRPSLIPGGYDLRYCTVQYLPTFIYPYITPPIAFFFLPPLAPLPHPPVSLNRGCGLFYTTILEGTGPDGTGPTIRHVSNEKKQSEGNAPMTKISRKEEALCPLFFLIVELACFFFPSFDGR